MAPLYDSDSSLSDNDDGNNGEYIETKVLLGYTSPEPTDDPISQLGGEPTWLSPNHSPSGSLARCKSCKGFMRMLLQLDGTLPDHFPDHQRRLYIFSCVRRGCKRKEGSVRAIRGVKVDKNKKKTSKSLEDPPKETKTKAGDSREEEDAKSEVSLKRDFGRELFGGGGGGSVFISNPFVPSPSHQKQEEKEKGKEKEGLTITKINPFANLDPPASLAAKSPQKSGVKETTGLSTSFAAKVSLNFPPRTPLQPQEPWPKADDLPKPYPKYYLDADYECLESTTTTQKSSPYKNLRIEHEQDEEGEGGGGKRGGNGNEKETFESSLDKTFQRFADRTSQNPEQVLRYEFGGIPLLYSIDDDIGKRLAASSYTSSQSHQSHRGESQRLGVGQGGRGGGGLGVGIPRCQNCGNERVFEIQLMPHSIVELEKNFLGDDDDDDDEDTRKGKDMEKGGLRQKGMGVEMLGSILEWGTVIVGVCSRDCFPLVSSSSPLGSLGGSSSTSSVAHPGGSSGGAAADTARESGRARESKAGNEDENEEGKKDKDEDEEGEVIGYIEEWVGVQWE